MNGSRLTGPGSGCKATASDQAEQEHEDHNDYQQSTGNWTNWNKKNMVLLNQIIMIPDSVIIKYITCGTRVY